MTKWDLANYAKKYTAQRTSFVTLVEYIKKLDLPTLEVGDITEDMVRIRLLGQTHVLAHSINVSSKTSRDEATGCITRYLLNSFDSRIAQKKFQISLDDYGNVFVPSEGHPERLDHYRVSEPRDLEDLFGVLFDLAKD